MQRHTVNSNSRTSNCQCSLFSKKNPSIRIFCISRWLAIPFNPDKRSSAVQILGNSAIGKIGFIKGTASRKLIMTILFPLVHSHYRKFQNFKHSSQNHYCQTEVPRTHRLRIPWFKIIKITKYTWKRTFPSESNTKTQLRPLSATRIWPYPLSTATSIGS